MAGLAWPEGAEEGAEERAEARGDVLAPLRSRCDCRVWEGPGPPPARVLRAELQDCEGLLCLLTDRVDAALIDACPRLRVISTCSVGVDHIDVEAAARRGIRVTNTPGVLVETTADLAFALILAAARRIPEADRFVRAGQWTPERRWEPDMLLGRDLFGATLGIVGLGEIGCALARRARGFGMRILAWNRTPRVLEGVEPVALTELLERSDFVSLHVAYVPQTRGLIDAAAISRMKRGAVLVNTSRGGIVDEAALARALADGTLAAAALDVFEEEPLAPGSPLLRAPNLVLTPHIGSASVRTRRRMAELAVENLLAGL
ncbi:MAG: D-glycerate dehydrogenase [Deltaproteobacteria bacterium]|nr:D-glycerate dehydrogenase [Deltaproteobacteria bacterium]